VAVLDGGLQSCTAAGYPLTAGIENPKKAAFDGFPDPNQWVTTHEVEAMLKDPSFVIIDARAPERFRGEQEPIDPVAGHIPGAVNHSYLENLTNDGYFLMPNQLYQAYEEIIGELPADHVIVYCGSGVTACHNLLAMEIAGLYGAKLYADSWSEWIRNPKRPIEVGE
jgi:thiosulfate/3-mercaptopyruvate sulfurtransferase